MYVPKLHIKDGVPRILEVYSGSTVIKLLGNTQQESYLKQAQILSPICQLGIINDQRTCSYKLVIN